MKSKDSCRGTMRVDIRSILSGSCIILIAVMTSVADAVSITTPRVHALSVLRPEESELHKYSAVLAATEPFRIHCNNQIRKHINPLKYIFLRLRGESLLAEASNLREEDEYIDKALLNYEARVRKTLSCYGMTNDEFNDLSMKLSTKANTRLKQRILLQAYYYRLAADLESNLKPSMPLLPDIADARKPASYDFSPPPYTGSAAGGASYGGSSVGSNLDSPSGYGGNAARRPETPPLSAERPPIRLDPNPDTVQKFAAAVMMIEHERLRLREWLMRELGVPELPQRMADPSLLPAMSPVIQRACQDFPRRATNIIERNDLQIDEFNQLQERTERNILFRWRVQKEIQNLEDQI